MPGPQSAVGRNPTALFHLCARISLDGAAKRRRVPRACIQLRTARVSPSSSRFRHACRWIARWRAAACMPSGLTRLACAKGVRYTQLSPTARSGKSVGSSPTSKMQKREYGWMRSAGRWIGARRAAGAARTGWEAHGYARAFASRSVAGMRVPAAIGRYGSFSGRCVRIQMNCRSSDPAPPARVAESALAGRFADDRCLRIDRFPAKPPFRACFILTTLLPRIVTVERPLRNARRRTRAFHGKTSVGAAWRDS